MTTQSNIRKTVLLLIGIMVICVGGFVYKTTLPRQMTTADLQANGAILFKHPRIIPNISLTDQDGDLFDNQSFLGKWVLVYPGYTYCPDICPVTLGILRNLWQLLSKEQQQKLQVVFMTVDPNRDTAPQLKDYMLHFNDQFLAIRADIATTYQFALGLNIAFSVKDYSKMQGNYTVDHTGNIALIGPNGFYRGFLKPPFSEKRLKLIIQHLFTLR